jgi:hypothetical protein
MDIVDAQVHVGRGKIDATLEAMDALGIRSVVIDEFWGTGPRTHFSHIDPLRRLPHPAGLDGGGGRLLRQGLL